MHSVATESHKKQGAKTHNRASSKKRFISFEKIVIFLAVVAFADLDSYSLWGISSVMAGLQLAATLLVVTYAICRNIKLNIFYSLWIILGIWTVIITTILDASITQSINFSAKIILPAILFATFGDDLESIIRSIFAVLSILAIINFISLLLFPDGLYVTGATNQASENWVLGFKNKHIVFFFPLILSTLYLCALDGVKVDKVIVLLIVGLSIAIAGSGTAIACLAVAFIFVLASFTKGKHSPFNARTYFLVSLALFVAVVILRLQDHFSFIIVDVLGKDLTFTNRTSLWDEALRHISEHPFVGAGYWEATRKHLLFNSQSIVSAHNYLLELMFTGGIISLLLFLGINFLLASRLRQYNSQRITRIASAIYFALSLALIVEVYEDFFFFVTFFMIWEAPKVGQIALSRRSRI